MRWTQASISSLRRYSATDQAYEAAGFSFRQLLHSAAYSPFSATSSSWVPSSATTPSMTTQTRSASWAVWRRCAMAMTVRPCEDGAQGSLEVTGGARIEQRGRLVEDERVGVAQDESRERQLLGLGGRDGIARRAEFGLHAFGQVLDPVERVDRRQARVDLLVARLGSREGQVVAHRCR